MIIDEVIVIIKQSCGLDNSLKKKKNCTGGNLHYWSRVEVLGYGFGY